MIADANQTGRAVTGLVILISKIAMEIDGLDRLRQEMQATLDTLPDGKDGMAAVLRSFLKLTGKDRETAVKALLN